jgi:hypothetical protein
MEILERHSIAIDCWSVLFPSSTTFLLSHLHTDHADIPKSFKYPVYASEVTGILCDSSNSNDKNTTSNAIRAILKPGCWYRTHQYHIPFKVYDTMHTVESIGFYFPSLSVLYMGDSVESIIPVVHRPLSVIYDGLYEGMHQNIPTPAQACTCIRQTLEVHCPVLQLVHHGILSFISSSCHTLFRLHSSAPLLVRKTALFLGIVDDTSPYMIVGRDYTDGPRIVPSSYWFMRDPSIDPFVTHVDGDKFRVFCSLHAHSHDIAHWKRTSPYAHFEALATTPV